MKGSARGSDSVASRAVSASPQHGVQRRRLVQRPDELLVELRHGRHLAGAQALDLGQRQLAARRSSRPG